MFKRIVNKLAGGLIGFVTGLIIGPFAAVGKFFSIVREESIGHEQRDSKGNRIFSGGPKPTPVLVGIPLAFATGFIYGPLRGLYLGAVEGAHKNLVKNIAREMFTYDPHYADIIDYQQVIRENPVEGRFLSYRTLRKKGVVNDFQRDQTTESKSTLSSNNQSDSTPLFFKNEKTHLISNDSDKTQNLTYGM